MFIWKNFQTAVFEVPVTREERHLRDVEKRIASKTAALEPEIAHGGSFTHERVNKRKSDVLERKRNNLTRLQTAHQRVDLRRQTLQTQRAQARGLAAASLVSAAASTAFLAIRPATRVAQALVNAYQKHEIKQDHSEQPLALRAGCV